MIWFCWISVPSTDYILPEPPPNPVILLSHIPLARSTAAPCGPRREREKGLRRGAGFGYQNLLGKYTTNFIFECLRPIVIFSGDDHDFCDYTHTKTGDAHAPVREVTIKSISMAMGIRRPGFHLLSLIPPSANSGNSTDPHATYIDKACLLPDQVKIYTMVYLPLLFITFIALVFINTLQPHRIQSPSHRSIKDLTPLRITSTSSNPSSPRLSARPHLSLRKTSNGPQSPIPSRSTTPIPSPLNSPYLLSTAAFNGPSYASPTSSHISLTSLLSKYASGGDSEKEDMLPIHTSSAPSTPRRRSGGWKQVHDDDLRESWWGRLVGCGGFMRMVCCGCRRGVPRIWNDYVIMRVLRDCIFTAWPPALVAGFIWWRLMSW